jgi:hypothetical protein
MQRALPQQQTPPIAAHPLPHSDGGFGVIGGGSAQRAHV